MRIETADTGPTGYGYCLPVELHLKVQDIINDSRMVPSLYHRVKCIDALNSGDLPGSIDHLHRYFDYTTYYRDRQLYHFALTILAVYQSFAGSHEEAVTTMLEAVSTARENRDHMCLTFALSWLLAFGRAHPQLVADLEADNMLGVGKETLAFLQESARDTGMHSLRSIAIWNEAQLCLENGDSVATAAELMVRGSQNLIENNMPDLFSNQSCVYLALWDRLALPALSKTTCEVFLQVHRPDSSLENELRILGRLADMTASAGRWDAAFDMLDKAMGNSINEKSLRAMRRRNLWLRHRAVLRLRQALHQADEATADELVDVLLLSACDGEFKGLEPELENYINILHVEVLILQKSFPAAFEKTCAMLSSMCSEDEQEESNAAGATKIAAIKDLSFRIRLLLLKTRLYALTGRPQKGFSTAVKAASLAFRARLVQLVWESMARVASILNSLCEFEAAAEVVRDVLPRALEGDNCVLLGTLYGELADAKVGMAGSMGAGSKDRIRCLRMAEEVLDSAEKFWKRVRDVREQADVAAKKKMIAKFVRKELTAEHGAVRHL